MNDGCGKNTVKGGFSVILPTGVHVKGIPCGVVLKFGPVYCGGGIYCPDAVDIGGSG